MVAYPVSNVRDLVPVKVRDSRGPPNLSTIAYMYEMTRLSRILIYGDGCV